MVPVEADDEHVTQFSGALQVADVPEVQQIETAVGGDDALAATPRRAPKVSELFQRQNLAGRGLSHSLLDLIPCNALT